MIKYSHLVQYIKENHINWDTDLFDVLRGFFSQYSPHPQPPSPSPTIQQNLYFDHTDFLEPVNGEYTPQDVMNLFSQ